MSMLCIWSSKTLRRRTTFAAAAVAGLALLLTANPSFAQCVLNSSCPTCPSGTVGVGGTGSGAAGQGQANAGLSDLSMTGGAGGGAASALPTIQGDTSWGSGRSTAAGIVFNYATGTPVFVPRGSDTTPFVPAGLNLKNSDFFFDLSNGTNVTSGFVLASPVLGFDMVNWAENAGILPQDRVFYDYRHYDNVGGLRVFNENSSGALTVMHSDTLNTDRHTVGLERMIGERSSIEVRLPFLYQIDARASLARVDSPNSVDANGLQNNVYQDPAVDLQLGNVGLAFKTYILDRENFKLTGGVGMQLPTQADTKFQFHGITGTRFSNGSFTPSDVWDVAIGQSNETVWLNPFLGYAYTPTERFFAQGLMQVDVPLNESHQTIQISHQAYGNTDPTQVQNWFVPDNWLTMQFNPVLRINPQFGYWLRNDEEKTISRIGALFEVDVNTMLGTGTLDTVVNLGPSLTAQVGKTEGSIGMLVPVSPTTAYDWELAVRLNRRF